MYEHMFESVAAGFVADELSKEYAEKFLKQISREYNEVYGVEEHKEENEY